MVITKTSRGDLSFDTINQTDQFNSHDNHKCLNCELHEKG